MAMGLLSSSHASLLSRTQRRHLADSLGVFRKDGNKTENDVVAVEFDTFGNPENRDLSSKDHAPSPAPGPSNETFEAKKKSKMRLVVGHAVGIGILLCGLGLVWYAVWRKRASGGMEAEEEEMALELSINNAFDRGGGPQKFSYGALAIATRNFVKEAKLGEGGFGQVYMGVLEDTKQEVAIKRISRDSKQGKKEYIYIRSHDYKPAEASQSCATHWLLS